MKNLAVFICLFAVPWTVHAASETPDCISNGKILPITTSEIINNKNSVEAYIGRAHIKGIVGEKSSCYPQSYIPFILDGVNGSEKVELYLSPEFTSPKAKLQAGTPIEVCGNFIIAAKKLRDLKYKDLKSNKMNFFGECKEAAVYPDDAIVHWTHSSNSDRQENGFFVIDGELFGQIRH